MVLDIAEGISMGLRRFLRLQKLSWRALFQTRASPFTIMLDVAPDTVTHPSQLCRCEDRRAHDDQSPYRKSYGHYLDCEWFAVMCRECDGAGHCSACGGDGVSSVPQCELRHDAEQCQWVSTVSITAAQRCCLAHGHHGSHAAEEICLNGASFCDGELTPEDAQRYRDHLGECSICAYFVLDYMQLSAQMSDISLEEIDECDHGVVFDHVAAENLPSYEIKRRWPRLDGPCPKGCGFTGIAYASTKHYVFGDW